MPKRKGKIGTFKNDIPSNNPHKYRSMVEPILETQRVNKEGIVNLSCRATHRVSLRFVKIKEDDAMYDIYARQIDHPVSFVREWLKLFVLMHRVQFVRKADKYLKSKGLSVELWSDNIMDGWKGDLLVLIGLNLLMETHCIVHLSNGQIWTTLATTRQTHSEDLKKCDIHLIYVG